MKIFRLLIVFAFLLVSNVLPAKDTPGEAIGANLPPKVRSLLIQEMNAILDASQKIIAALARGQDDVVATHAQAIHDSFIMKQQMTSEDKEALLNAVPDDFVNQDRTFHQLSARLAKAARDKDKTKQQKLFADMIGACVTCHSRYAIDRFPGFRTDN